MCCRALISSRHFRRPRNMIGPLPRLFTSLVARTRTRPRGVRCAYMSPGTPIRMSGQRSFARSAPRHGFGWGGGGAGGCVGGGSWATPALVVVLAAAPPDTRASAAAVNAIWARIEAGKPRSRGAALYWYTKPQQDIDYFSTNG